jgi:alkylation response protein AidB-like acyl-CoA dehydrogenase
MDFSLSQDQAELREEIVRFARDVLNGDVIERDRVGFLPRDLWSRCAEIGLTGLPAPEEFGGVGLDPLSCAISLESLGYGCRDGGLVFAVCAHVVACVVPISKYGSDDQKRRFLPGLCNGSLIGAHAMSEPNSGSDAFAMRTRAVRDGNGFRINGSKTFVSNGGMADLAVIFAVTDESKGFHGGVTGFLVDTGSPGLVIGKPIEKMGLRTSPMVELALDDVFVADDRVLGGLGGGAAVFSHSMDWERTCLFASHVGAMQRLVDECVRYASVRSQFGQSIGKFQAISHRIADMKVRLEASRLLVYRAAVGLERGRAASMDAAIAKLFVSESFVENALDAVQVHGGYGYTVEYEVERILRDAVGSRIYSGTSEMQRNIIARWLGL